MRRRRTISRKGAKHFLNEVEGLAKGNGPKMISSVVLAAGRAGRTGEHTLLFPLGEKPVLQQVLETALASALHEIVCVVHNLEAVRRKISLVAERLYWLTNHAADQGQSTSVIAGLWAIHPKSNGAFFFVGDNQLSK